MPANAPLVPSVIARRSLSLRTQAMTKSWPSAADCGVGAARPPNFSVHALALAGVLLNTVTSWPPFLTRCHAMGKPITPRPRKATLAMCATLGFAGATELAGRYAGEGAVGPGRASKQFLRGLGWPTINPVPCRAPDPLSDPEMFLATSKAQS